MKALLYRLIVFGLLGLALQLVFVFWSVYFHESRRTPWVLKLLLGFPYIAASDRSNSGWMLGPTDEHGNRWRIRVDRNQRGDPFQIRFDSIAFGDGSERSVTPAELPAWSRVTDFPTSSQSRGGLKIVEQVGGWPFRAWRAEYRVDGALAAPRCIMCLPDQRGVWLGSWMEVTLYPYGPMFPGVISNTLIHGTTLYIVFRVTRHYGRRYRRWSRLARGRCPNCAYDIRGQSACPECGRRLA